MTLEHFGTVYGGWTICPELLPAEGLVIDAGIGTDLSFAQALKERFPLLWFIGIDHTDESAEYVRRLAIPNYRHVQAAVAGPDCGETVTMFRHRERAGSESLCEGHACADAADSYIVPAVHLKKLIREYRPDLVKLDIEGAEYDVYRETFGVRQVCIEFHHRMLADFSDKDTDDVIADFTRRGYKLMHRSETDEILFVLPP